MTTLLQGDPTEGHTSRVFDQALAELRLGVVAMGGLVVDQVAAAARALLTGDLDAARLVLDREDRVNHYEQRVDHDAFQLIALHQPVAGDLRMARAISRATVEFERAGDEAKKIARFALRLGEGEPQGPVVAVSRYLRHMADLSVDMLRGAVRALDESDAEMASRVELRDAELDREFQAALRQILTLVMEDQRYLKTTIDTVLALKGLERIGDHAKNVAEQVRFMLSGEDVRHEGTAGRRP
jgi:phosphate transport system protein